MSQTFSTVLRIYRPSTVGFTIVNAGGSTFPGAATVTMTSSLKPVTTSFTGGIGSLSNVPPAQFTVSAATTNSGTGWATGVTSGSVVQTVPTSYPTNLTSAFTLTLPYLLVTVKQSVSGVCQVVPGATVTVTGGPGSVNMSLTADAQGKAGFVVRNGGSYTHQGRLGRHQQDAHLADGARRAVGDRDYRLDLRRVPVTWARRVVRRLQRAAAATEGFTVIELMVSLALLGILVGPLAAMLSMAGSKSEITMNQDASLSQARAAVEQIVERRARGVHEQRRDAGDREHERDAADVLFARRPAAVPSRRDHLRALGREPHPRVLREYEHRRAALDDSGARPGRNADGRLREQLDDLHLPGRERRRDDRSDQGQPGARDRHDHARRRRSGDDLPGQRDDPGGGHGMSRLRSRLCAEDGQTLMLVLGITMLMSTLAMVLVDVVVGGNTRSAQSVKQQTAYQAAEAGIDDYTSKLVEDSLYFTHYVHAAESTRKATNGTLVAAGAAWPYDLNWTYPVRHNAWLSLPNGYQYNLEITPPSAATNNATTILSTGRPANDTNTSDWVSLQVQERPGSLADYTMFSDAAVSYGSTAITNGQIYSNSTVNHSGTASASIFAYGGFSGSVTLQNGAKVYSGAAAVQAVLPNAPINFNSFLGALVNVQNASQSGGVYLNDMTVAAWQIVFQPDGTFTAQTCQQASGQDVAAAVPVCGAATTYNVPRTARSTRRRPSSSPARSTDASPSRRTTTSTSAAARAT